MKTQKITARKRVVTDDVAGVRRAMNEVVNSITLDSADTNLMVNWDTMEVSTEVEWTETSFLAKSVTHSRRAVYVVLEVEASR